MGSFFGLLLTIVFWFVIVRLVIRALRSRKVDRDSLHDRRPLFRGSVGRNWARDEYDRLADLDEDRQAQRPATLDEMTDDLEATLREEEECALQLREAVDKRRNMVARLRAAADEWRERAALAVAKGRDDLARKALVEAHECEDAIARCEEAIGELEPILASFDTEIEQLRRRLNDDVNRRLVAEARAERARHGLRADSILSGERAADLDAANRAVERLADEEEGKLEAERLGRLDALPDADKRAMPDPPRLDHRVEIDREISQLKQAAERDPEV